VDAAAWDDAPGWLLALAEGEAVLHALSASVTARTAPVIARTHPGVVHPRLTICPAYSVANMSVVSRS
jgi:hypothetical protein